MSFQIFYELYIASALSAYEIGWLRFVRFRLFILNYKMLDLIPTVIMNSEQLQLPVLGLLHWGFTRLFTVSYWWGRGIQSSSIWAVALGLVHGSCCIRAAVQDYPQSVTDWRGAHGILAIDGFWRGHCLWWYAHWWTLIRISKPEVIFTILVMFSGPQNKTKQRHKCSKCRKGSCKEEEGSQRWKGDKDGETWE